MLTPQRGHFATLIWFSSLLFASLENDFTFQLLKLTLQVLPKVISGDPLRGLLLLISR